MGNVCATDKATATKDAATADKPAEMKPEGVDAKTAAPAKVEEPKKEEKKQAEAPKEEAEKEAEAPKEEEAKKKESAALDSHSEIDAAIVLELLKGEDDDFQAIVDNLDNKEVMLKWWGELDHNGNGIVSLSEIQKWVRDQGWDVKAPALMEAYKFTTAKGDDFVQKNEFPRLCRGLVYMNRLWDLFDDIDTSDDRRMSLDEFKAAFAKLGYPLTDDAAETTFNSMDKNEGGMVLFGEFGRYVVKLAHPNQVEFDEEEERGPGE